MSEPIDREEELRRRLEAGDDPEALRELAALVGRDRARRGEAVELHRRLVRIVEESRRGTALLALARAEIEARRTGDAIETLRRCTEVSPEMAEAYDLLGQLLRGAGRLEEAVGVLRRAAELEPANLRPRLVLVVCLDSLGRRDEATRILQGAAESAGEDAAVQALIREILHRRT
jgi:Flp pilus assembly protein TadD